MDDLYHCMRIMQISTDKLQSARYAESLHRSSLIRSTFLQSRKHFCDLIYAFMKISSTAHCLVPVMISSENRLLDDERVPPACRTDSSSKRRQSDRVTSVKRLRSTSSSSSSSSSSTVPRTETPAVGQVIFH